MIVTSRFDSAEDLQPLLAEALAAFAARPGFVRGRVGRSPDEPTAWLLSTEWEGVASYRRALSPYDVKVALAPLMAHAVDDVSAFEVLDTADQEQPALPPPSARAR